MEASEYVTTAAFAARLGVNSRTISKWVREGLVAPAIKVPGTRGAYLFDPAEVERVASERAA